MPKMIDITLQKISCQRNGFGGSVQITGSTSGATFQNNPDNPNDQKDRQEIFPFPAGPIGISQGQTIAITMQPVRFSLSAPSLEPPDLNPKFLKFGGQLNNGLGNNFKVIRFDDPLPFKDQGGETEVLPREFALDFNSANLSVTLTFGLIVAQVF